MDAEEISKILATIELYALEAAYGRAVLAAYSLEQTLYVLLVIRLPKAVVSNKRETFDHEQKKLQKLTLGRLVERVIAEFEIHDHWQEELDNMVYFRNRLVHSIAVDITTSVLRHGNKQRIVEELEEIRSYFIETNREMRKILFACLEPNGLTEEKVNEIARALLSQVNTEV